MNSYLALKERGKDTVFILIDIYRGLIQDVRGCGSDDLKNLEELQEDMASKYEAEESDSFVSLFEWDGTAKPMELIRSLPETD
jgi:hypothetical protein